MSVFNNILLGASSQGGVTPVHTINQSIRFNDDDTAHMTRTFGSGNQKVWTMSFWVKRCNLGTGQKIISRRTGGGSTTATMGFRVTTDQFDFYDPSNGGELITDAVFRDTSAWYNFVINYEASNVTQSERLRIYVNGTRQTFTSNVAISDSNGNFNAAVTHAIGKYQYNNSDYLDAYLAEIVWIDGTALDPSSFGETNSSGIWIPKDVSGLTFGTNGFHITGATASDLGADVAGSNNFTTSGLDQYDKVLDSPTNNFCVMNPNDADGLAANELSGGNLQVKNINRIRSTLPFPTSGKWYWEICTVSKGGQPNWNYGMVYFKDQAEPLLTNNDFIRLNWYHGSNFSSSSNWTDGDFWTNSNNPSAGSVYGFAWDAGTRKVYLAKDGTFFGSADPVNGTGTAWGSGGTAGVEYGIAMYSTQSMIHTINFGQDDSFNGAKTSGSDGASDSNGNGKFYETPPTGFLALCTKNLGS
tara:strand:+ start:71 stop:1483 length:1413 start_codon:yes stop_codon:yes gene_type:complete